MAGSGRTSKPSIAERRRSGLLRALDGPVDAATAILMLVSWPLGLLALARDKLAEGFAGIVHGDFDRESSPLELELDGVRALIAPHSVRLSVSASAMKAMQAGKMNRKSTRKYIQRNIRWPLAKLIGQGELRRGHVAIIEWNDGIALRVQDEIAKDKPTS